MQELNLAKPKEKKHSVWALKDREDVLYYPSQRQTYGEIQAEVGITGFVEETGSYVVFSEQDHMLPIKSLDRFDIWDCYFPNSEVHVYGLQPGEVPQREEAPANTDQTDLLAKRDSEEEGESEKSTSRRRHRQNCTIS